ncbi:glycosyltransferase family 2 protein, partial [bacterium]|nr:glycosyltransferase family 2 protein [bacterium]
MSADRVVVCTPTFHRAELLKRAIESVLGQTYRDFEHVVVQDGCDRGGECAACRETAAVGERFQKHDPRFRFVVLPEHMGGYGFYSRNWAIEHSDAPLIAYLDDDNWWEPTHLETLVNALRVSRASFAFSGTIMRDQRGRTIHR